MHVGSEEFRMCPFFARREETTMVFSLAPSWVRIRCWCAAALLLLGSASATQAEEGPAPEAQVKFDASYTVECRDITPKGADKKIVAATFEAIREDPGASDVARGLAEGPLQGK
jgi:hypothetical protein